MSESQGGTLITKGSGPHPSSSSSHLSSFSSRHSPGSEHLNGLITEYQYLLALCQRHVAHGRFGTWFPAP